MTIGGLIEALADVGFSNRQLEQSKTRQLVWAHDASHFRILPGATLRASNTEQVSQLLAAATRQGVSVTFRSGGSSLSGQTLGSGVVVDTRSSFQRLIEIGPESVRAEPGITLARLNAHLARKGRKIGPDPASSVASTLGGAVSNNSSGMTCGTKFNSYATIKAAKIVFADGSVIDSSAPDAPELLLRQRPDLHALLEEKRDAIRSNPELVSTLRRLFSLKNTMGYALNAFLDFDEPLEILLRLLVGSEGTLGFLSEIELTTQAVASVRSASLLVFDSLEQANENLLSIIEANPAAIELMDGTSLEALRAEGQLPEEVLQRLGEDSAAILVEFEASEQSALQAAEDSFASQFGERLVFHGTSGETRDLLWSMRKGLYAIVAKARPAGTTALLEDVAVPPQRLTEACEQLRQLCQRHGYGKPVIFGHVRDGNIHFMISDDFADQERVKVFEAFTLEMVDLILALEGNLKAEHGTGRAMAPFVERQFGSELYAIMREIKTAFDPAGVLNPGVIFPAHERDYLENLKSTTTVSPTVDSCVECGYCESSCPSSGLTLTPRERIVAFRERDNASVSDQKLLDRELHYQADQTCAVDGMCAVNCPVGINTGTFVKTIRAEQASKTAQALGRMANRNWDSLTGLARTGLKLAGKTPGLATGASKIVAKTFPRGVFPQYQSHVESNGFSRSRLIGGDSEFVFLPSCMNEVFGEPKLQQLIELAGAQDIPLSVPEAADGFCCGTPFSSKGLTDARENRLRDNRALLQQLDGKQVVIDGSSCHQTLLEQAGVTVLELTEFIAAHLLDVPVNRRQQRIVLHPTCSGEKTGSNTAMEEIARHIADEVVIPANWRCCGFAGDRGLFVPELTENATAQEAAEVSEIDAVFVSNNQPCQVGMSGATKRDYRSITDVWMESVS